MDTVRPVEFPRSIQPSSGLDQRKTDLQFALGQNVHSAAQKKTNLNLTNCFEPTKTRSAYSGGFTMETALNVTCLQGCDPVDGKKHPA